MRTQRRYTLLHTFLQTAKYILVFILWSTFVVWIYVHFELQWMGVPWLPLALIGTAVAFYLGFKNNAAYERLSEARMIWGNFVNASRSFGVLLRDYMRMQNSDQQQKTQQRLVYRHIAWLYTLTFQLREPGTWATRHRNRLRPKKRQKTQPEPERYEYIREFISDADYQTINTKQNRAVQLLAIQSQELRALEEEGALTMPCYLELTRLIETFYDLQGQSERIKDFPFPRQYASINVFFVGLFIVLLPLGMVSEFDKLGNGFIWLTVPFTVIISWVFHTMEMIGDFSENPFEGLYDDVPITSITRKIEIDLRELLGETDLPPNIKPMTAFKILF